MFRTSQSVALISLGTSSAAALVLEYLLDLSAIDGLLEGRGLPCAPAMRTSVHVREMHAAASALACLITGGLII
jgi:hypothetical protein